mgnify:CR=1 FL=1
MLPGTAVLPQMEEAQHWQTQTPAGAHKPQEGRRGRRRREGRSRPEDGHPEHAIHAHPLSTRHALQQQQPRRIHGLHAHGPRRQDHQQHFGPAPTIQQVPVPAGVDNCARCNNAKGDRHMQQRGHDTAH